MFTTNNVQIVPTVFGRELIEQVRTDSVSEHRDVPLIVEKCILAVEYSGTFSSVENTVKK